jgi:hypothetical protein
MLALWFIQLPDVKSAKFYTQGMKDHFDVVLEDGTERRLSSGVLPKLLLQAMQLLLELLEKQLHSETRYEEQSQKIWCSVQKRRRRRPQAAIAEATTPDGDVP